MKASITYFLICWLSIQAFSQDITTARSIKGIVVDSASGKPLPGASVTLKDGKANEYLKAGLTNEAGKFEFSILQNYNILIELEYVGYQKKTLPVTNTADKDFGIILLSLLPSQLANVTVTATRPLIKQEIDRISYDVQADPENKAQSVLDMLRKVPLISIDGDDNIKLKGNSNYRILINGRPSSLVARDPKEAFKAMPAGTILKIEVITTPPAKYDGEGLAGIINIITIKKTGDGYFVSLGMRYNSVNGIAANGSITSRLGKFGLTASGNLYQNFERITTTAYSRNTYASSELLKQHGNSTYKGSFKNAQVELTYDIDSLSIITLSLGLFNSNYRQDIAQRSEVFYNSSLSEGYNLLNKGKNLETGFDMDANYQIGFRRHKGQLMTLSYNQVYFPNENRNQLDIYDRMNYVQPDFNQSNDNGTRENTVQIDFIRPSTKLTFDLGGKAIFRNSFSNFTTQVYDASTQMYLSDSSQSNNFSYSQDVYSFYNSWYYRIKTSEIKAGIRLEHTEVNADFETDKNAVRQSYTHVLPSVSFRQNLSNKENVVFGFTQRIYRPGIWRLNPFVNRINPRIISSGNPRLKAVLNNNFELNYSRAGKGSFNAGVSYLFANNTVENVTTVKDTVSYSVYQNIGKYRNLQGNISLYYPLNQKLSFTLNGQLSYIIIKGSYNGMSTKNDGIEGNVTANFVYKISDNWRFSFNNNFIGPYVLLQGRTNSVYTSSFNLSKFFLNKKLTIAVVVNNPYQKFRYAKTYIEAPDFFQLNNLQRNYRSINVSATWNLGSLKSSLKKTNKKIINDDTRQ